MGDVLAQGHVQPGRGRRRADDLAVVDRERGHGLVEAFGLCFGLLEAALQGGVLGGVELVGHAGADGVEVVVGHGGPGGELVGHVLGAEAALPEAAGAAVLEVGAAGDGLVEAAHVPGQVAEAVAQHGEAVGVVEQFGDRVVEQVGVLGREDGEPATGDVVVGEFEAVLGGVVDGDVVVVGHDGVGLDVDGEDAGEEEEALLDPGAAVGEVEAGEGVGAAEHGAADASGAEVVDAAVNAVDDFASGSSHGPIVGKSPTARQRTTPRVGVRVHANVGAGCAQGGGRHRPCRVGFRLFAGGRP